MGEGGGTHPPFYMNPKFQPGKIFVVHALHQKQRVDLQRAKSASKAFCAKSLMPLNKFCLSNDYWALPSVLEWFPWIDYDVLFCVCFVFVFFTLCVFCCVAPAPCFCALWFLQISDIFCLFADKFLYLSDQLWLGRRFGKVINTWSLWNGRGWLAGGTQSICCLWDLFCQHQYQNQN